MSSSGAAAQTESPPLLTAPALWRRMACWLYEGMLMFGLVFIADYLFDTLSQSRHALTHRGLRMAYLFVVFGIYFGWFWSRGQTLAQKTWHIRVVSADAASVKAPLSQARAVLRYVLCWLWFLPPLAAYSLGLPLMMTLALLALWVLVWAWASKLHPQQQFWHDQLAGTRLIHYRTPPRRKG